LGITKGVLQEGEREGNQVVSMGTNWLKLGGKIKLREKQGITTKSRGNILRGLYRSLESGK